MQKLFAATGKALTLLSSEADGWTARETLSDRGIQCLAADPVDARVLYAGSRGQGVWKTEDGGETFRDMRLPQPDVFSLAVSAADGAVYAGCEPSMLFRSADGGETWEELSALREIPSAPTWSFPPRPWTSHVRWVAPCPHDAGRLLAGIELGGLMLSRDGGRTWTDHRSGAQKDVHALAWHPHVPGRAYEAGGGGAAWSRDSGETWQPADDGRDRHYTWGLAVDPEDTDRWYVSASPGPRQAHSPGKADAYLYRRHGDGPWQQIGVGLPQPLDSMPYALAFAGSVLYTGLSDGRIYASADRGDSWRRLEIQGQKPESILALASAS
ncbi:MAG TPA: hypothetical protein VFA07_01060 [Chthonomonadaceae bacterium]|nr:hypothetical protein [Chthonomonadaceae bacterium]